MQQREAIQWAEEPEPSLQLQQIFWIIRKYIGIIVAVTATTVLLTALWVFRQQPMFKAAAVIEVRPERFDVGEQIYKPLAAFTLDTFIQTQLNIAQRRAIAERVVQRYGVEQLMRWFQIDASAIPAAVKSREAYLVGVLLSHIQARRYGQTFLIEIGMEAPTPIGAAMLANGWAETLIDFNRELEVELSRTAGTALTEQIQRLQRSIAEKEARLSELAQQVQIQILDQQFNVALQKMESISQQITDAEKERLERQARLRQLQTAQAETLPEVRSDPTVQSLYQECARAQQAYEEKRKIFKPNWPGLKKLDSERRALCDQYRQAMQDLYRTLLRQAEAELRATEDKLAMLHAEFDRIKQEMDRLNQTAAEYHTLKAEIENQRKLLETMTQRQQQAKISETGTLQSGAIMRIVEYADPPKAPYRPRRTRTLLFALLIGLFAGTGLAFGLHLLDDRIYTHEDIQRCTDRPILTIIPDCEGEGDTHLIRNALKFLHSALTVQPESADAPRIIVVTSAQPEEGKTFVATNLALQLADVGHRVLLIDADLYHPCVHEVFQVTRRPDLVDVFGETQPPDFARLVRVPPNLFLIPIRSGLDTRIGVTLFSSPQFSQRLQMALQVFDYILIDTPPVLAAADTLHIARWGDGILLVIGCEMVTRRMVREVVERFERAGLDIIGVVLNRVPFSKRYSYYYYYYYRYYRKYGKAYASDRAP